MKKTHYVEPIVNIRCREWKNLGFFDKSKPIPFTDKLGRPQTTSWKIMNLEPFFLYCKEKHNIEFAPEEKDFVDGLLTQHSHIRKIILILYPNDDIINAILKFYIKYFPLTFDALHGHSKIKFDKEYIELMARAEKDAKKVISLNLTKNKKNPRLAKKYLDGLRKIDKISSDNSTKEDLEKMDKILAKVILYSMSYFYMTNYIKSPSFVLNVDIKFMKVLGIA